MQKLGANLNQPTKGLSRQRDKPTDCARALVDQVEGDRSTRVVDRLLSPASCLCLWPLIDMSLSLASDRHVTVSLSDRHVIDFGIVDDCMSDS